MNTEEVELQSPRDDSGPMDSHSPRGAYVVPSELLAPIDQSFHRGVGTRPNYGARPSLWDVEGVLTAPGLALYPENITALDDYTEEDAGYVASAVQAMAALADGVKKVIEARESLKTDPTQTDAAKVIAITDLQTRVMTPATRKVDAAFALLTKAIGETEALLRAPMTAGSNGGLAQEVRTFVRSLSTSERQTLLSQAIIDGDSTTAGAVLGCPVPYLAGITKEMQAALTEQWNLKRNPLVARRLSLMKKAASKLEDAGASYLRTMEQTAGVRHSTVARLKERRDKVRAVVGSIAA